MIGYCHYPYIIVALLLIYTHSTNQLKVCIAPHYAREKLLKEKPGLFGTPGKYGNSICAKLSSSQKQEICEEVIRWATAEAPHTVARHAEIIKRYKWIRVDKFLDQKSSLPIPPVASSTYPYSNERLEIEGLGYEKLMFWCPNRVFSLYTRWNNYDTSSSESDSTESDSSESESSESESSESDTEKTHQVKTNPNWNTNSNSMSNSNRTTNSNWNTNTNWMANSNWNTNTNSMTNSNKSTSTWKTNSNEASSEIKTAEIEGFFLACSSKEFDLMFALKPSSTSSRKVTPWAVLTWVRQAGQASLRC